MRKTPNTIPVDRLRECLREEGGRLFWLRRPAEHFQTVGAWKIWNIKFAGKEAGRLSITRKGKQRWEVVVDYKFLLRSRVVWTLHHGEWPASEIDHRDRDPSNDQIENLRLATRSQNLANTSLCAKNTSGFKGVRWRADMRKWWARIKVNKRTICLGSFVTREAAHEAYRNAATKYFGEFAHVRG